MGGLQLTAFPERQWNFERTKNSIYLPARFYWSFVLILRSRGSSSLSSKVIIIETTYYVVTCCEKVLCLFARCGKQVVHFRIAGLGLANCSSPERWKRVWATCPLPDRTVLSFRLQLCGLRTNLCLVRRSGENISPVGFCRVLGVPNEQAVSHPSFVLCVRSSPT